MQELRGKTKGPKVARVTKNIAPGHTCARWAGPKSPKLHSVSHVSCF